MNSQISTIGFKVATLDDIQQYSPAAFATSKSSNVSDKYSFVPTYELLEAFGKLNWNPTHTRQVGKKLHARHIVRLENPDLGYMDLKSDKVKPHVILDNSHNGTSHAQMHMGLFRLVCTNGLVVAMPGMFTSVKLRHMGIDMNELKQLLEVVANQYTILGTHIGDMQSHTLNKDQKEEFAIRAIAARDSHIFVKEDGTIDVRKVTSLTNPIELIDPLRGEDRKDDLWSVFNVVQERLVKGEFEKRAASGRKSKPRVMTNAIRHTNFNRDLWEIAESYMTPSELILS